MYLGTRATLLKIAEGGRTGEISVMNGALILIATSASLLVILACSSPSSDPLTPTASQSGSPSSVSTIAPISSPRPSPMPVPTPTPTPPPPTPTPVEGPGYGGHYIDPDDDSVVYIFLVNPSQEAAEKVAQTHISSLVYEGIKKVREVRPVQANYSFRQLQRWYDQLLDSGIWAIPEVTMSDVDEGINRIEYGIDCERNRDMVEKQIRDILSRENVSQDAVEVTVWGRAMSGMFECAPIEVVDPVTELSSPGFGGLFFDRASGTVTVYMLEPSQQKAEELAFEVVGRDTLARYPTVRAVQGQYTWEQLQGWHDKVNKGSLDHIAHRLPSGGSLHLYIDESKNRLRVELGRERTPEVEAAARDFLDRLGVPREAVVFEE